MDAVPLPHRAILPHRTLRAGLRLNPFQRNFLIASTL
jgi:hypothetical protein